MYASGVKVHNRTYRSIWPSPDGRSVHIIDQTRLPYEFATIELASCAAMADAIKTMKLRGAPLIGVAGAYGLALAMGDATDDESIKRAQRQLLGTRPTAVNLQWALNAISLALLKTPEAQRAETAWRLAAQLADEDAAMNRAIGQHGAELLQRMQHSLARPLNVLTHCNAGWLATVDYGTALSAIYQAFDAGLPLHVYVSETRPRNQGVLTAWELEAHGVPFTFIADNAAGHLMANGDVDAVLVGADRVTRRGDVCNKVGTYLKALAAHDNHIPFYAAVPSPTIDWMIERGEDIAIEMRDPDEVRTVSGRDERGQRGTVALVDEITDAVNPAFDVTPARLVTGIITELGICAPDQLESLSGALLRGTEPAKA